MKITVHSSKAIKPAYSGSRRAGGAPAVHDVVVPLTVFDQVHLGEYMSGIHAFHPPSPPPAVLEAGLARALAEYPEWAGRLVVDDASTGRTVILLDADDACGGVRFVEATADVDLATALPLLQPASPEVRLLHPSSDDGAVGELMLVQVTRFTCGSFVVGHTMHHAVGDGLGICNALLAWGQATRGATFDPVPVHDRTSFFVPRQPPQVDFEHRGVEFSISSKQAAACDDDEKKQHLCSSSGDDDSSGGDDDDSSGGGDDGDDVIDDVVTHKVRFSREFVSSLKLEAAAAVAAAGTGRTHTTTQCVIAHLWRCMSEAWRLDGDQVTALHIAVNGRGGRMRCPRVPDGYTGNVVLWAHPAATAGELLARPLSHAAELVRRGVARVDDSYFRSFIDFVSSGAVEEEGLLPMSDAAECPDAEVYCLRRIPFYDLHFAGGGQQFLFIPSYSPVDGLVYILPSSPLDDGSIEAHVSLFRGAMDIFKDLCSSKGVA